MAVTTIEKTKRLSDIKNLLSEGCSDTQIAEKLHMSLAVVKRNIKELDEVSKSVISIEEMIQARIEIDEEFKNAIEEAKSLFFKFRCGEEARDKNGNPILDSDGNKLYKYQHSAIRDYYNLWTDTLMKRAVLYGLDKIKQEALIQVNTQNNYLESDIKFSSQLLEKVGEEIIKNSSKKFE